MRYEIPLHRCRRWEAKTRAPTLAAARVHRFLYSAGGNKESNVYKQRCSTLRCTTTHTTLPRPPLRSPLDFAWPPLRRKTKHSTQAARCSSCSLRLPFPHLRCLASTMTENWASSLPSCPYPLKEERHSGQTMVLQGRRRAAPCSRVSEPLGQGGMKGGQACSISFEGAAALRGPYRMGSIHTSLPGSPTVLVPAGSCLLAPGSRSQRDNYSFQARGMASQRTSQARLLCVGHRSGEYKTGRLWPLMGAHARPGKTGKTPGKSGPRRRG